jgi:hypothetical protein
MDDFYSTLYSILNKFEKTIIEVIQTDISDSNSKEEKLKNYLKNLSFQLIEELNITKEASPLLLKEIPYVDIKNSVEKITSDINNQFINILDSHQASFSSDEIIQAYLYGVTSTILYSILLVNELKTPYFPYFDVAKKIDEYSAFILLSLYEREDNTITPDTESNIKQLVEYNLCELENNERVILTQNGLDLINRHRDLLLYKLKGNNETENFANECVLRNYF